MIQLKMLLLIQTIQETVITIIQALPVIIPVVTQVVLPAVTQVALPAVIQVALPAVIQVVVLPVVLPVVVLPVVVLPVVIQVALPAEILLSNHIVQAYDIYRKVSTGPATGSSFQMHDNKKTAGTKCFRSFLLYLTSKRMYNSLKALKNQFRSSTDTGIIS